MPKKRKAKNTIDLPQGTKIAPHKYLSLMSILLITAAALVVIIAGPRYFLGDIYFDLVDADNDGVSDKMEQELQTTVYNSDTDVDKLGDGKEINFYGTDPKQKDTDNDGHIDYTEVLWGSDPVDWLSVPEEKEGTDTDADGLTDEEERDIGTKISLDDTDEDGALDGEEVNTLGTDPLNQDTDLDLLKDGAEVKRGLDPLKADTDGDGKTDYEEIYQLNTNPFLSDPAREDSNIFKPLSLLSRKYQSEGYYNDEPGALVEVIPENPIDTEPICAYHPLDILDNDGDRVPDEIEQFFGIDPFNSDTDGDGFPDGHEIRNGFSPWEAQPKAYLFRDVESDWQRKAIGELAYIVALEGRVTTILSDIEPHLVRRYEPNKEITRAEFLKLVVSLLQQICDQPPYITENIFTDMVDTDWYYDTILYAHALGLVRGYPDRTIKPNQTITRAEAVKIVTIAFGVHEWEPIAFVNDFNDVSVRHWAYHFVNLLHERDVIAGTDGRFVPDQNVTRAEAAKIIGKSFHFVNDKLYRRLGEMKDKIDRR